MAPTHDALHKNEILSLHPARVFGLDVSAQDLQFAMENTAVSRAMRRWEDLEAKIWEGSLDVVNEAFVDVDCVVAMEVYVSISIISHNALFQSGGFFFVLARVEHLPDDFPNFLHLIILGVSHPR